MVIQGCDCRLCTFLGRVQKPYKTDQYQVPLIVYAQFHTGHIVFLCHRNHPETVPVVLFADSLNLLQKSFIQLQDLPVPFGVGTDCQHFLHGSLGYQLLFAVLVFQEHTHSAAGEVKGDLIQPGVAV